MELTKVWDWISVSSVAILLFPFIHYTITLDLAYAACFIGLIATGLLTSYIKAVSFKTIDAGWVRRPPGALNCDIMCRNGDKSGAPGFPSGHMAHAAFFATFIMILAAKRRLPSKYPVFAAAILYTALTAAARYYKRCHNIQQILAGSVLGALLAVPTALITAKWQN